MPQLDATPCPNCGAVLTARPLGPEFGHRSYADCACGLAVAWPIDVYEEVDDFDF